MRWLSLTILLVALIIGASFFGRPVEFSFAETTDDIAGVITAPYRAFTERLVTWREGEAPEHTTTILLLGRAGAGWTAGNLTDTIIVATLNGSARSATLLSLPRDLLVRSGAYRGKINALWQLGQRYGSDVETQSALIRETTEQITGLHIDDVIVVDVSGVEKMIDDLGGISIQVTEPITDPRYPTPGGGTELFSIEEGFHVLNGLEAVKYARTRHTPEGDFGRIRRQHQVIEAIVSKARSLRVGEDLGTVAAILQTLNSHVATTLSVSEIADLVLLGRGIPFSNVKTYALETLQARGSSEPLLTGAGFASGLVPRTGFYEYDEIREAVEELLTE